MSFIQKIACGCLWASMFVAFGHAAAPQGLVYSVSSDVTAAIGSGVSVHSFEPNPDCYHTPRKNVVSLPGISTYPVALGENEGGATFHFNARSHSSSLLPLAESHIGVFPEARETGAMQVMVSTLDRIFGGMDLSSPTLLKLDVQEAQVLRGGAEMLKRGGAMSCWSFLQADVSGRNAVHGFGAPDGKCRIRVSPIRRTAFASKDQ